MKTNCFQNASNLRWSLSHHLQCLWKKTHGNKGCDGVFPQLGSSNCMWGYKRWHLPFSSPLAGLLSFIWAPVPCPEESPQDRVPDAVLRVAGEGDGDGKASAPLNLLHPVEVLRSRSEKRHPACKDKDFNPEWSLPLSCSSPYTAQLLSGSSCSLVTWEPIGDHRQTAMSLHCPLTAFYCFKHTLMLCATKLEMQFHRSL